MIRVKNGKRFKVFIVISLLVLILLVCCIIWINASDSKQKRDNEDIQNENNIAKIEQEIEEENSGDKKEEKIEDDQEIINKTNENDSKVSKEDSTENSTENNNVSINQEEEANIKNTNENATKPVVVPDNLPEDELFSAYNNALLIGDSRTEGFKLYSGVKNATYFCMKAISIDKIIEGKKININGSNSSVYDLLNSATYDKVIVSVGLNELGWTHIEKFIEDYGKLVDDIKQKQPNATIYLQAILPVSKKKDDTDKIYNNAQIYWYNENIIKLASDKGVQFINPAAAVVDSNGYLVDGATRDGVHLNSEYCKAWAKYMAQLV